MYLPSEEEKSNGISESKYLELLAKAKYRPETAILNLLYWLGVAIRAQQGILRKHQLSLEIVALCDEKLKKAIIRKTITMEMILERDIKIKKLGILERKIGPAAAEVNMRNRDFANNYPRLVVELLNLSSC
jgi:hypothetical protein